jgi:hypothetical protein
MLLRHEALERDQGAVSKSDFHYVVSFQAGWGVRTSMEVE